MATLAANYQPTSTFIWVDGMSPNKSNLAEEETVQVAPFLVKGLQAFYTRGKKRMTKPKGQSISRLLWNNYTLFLFCPTLMLLLVFFCSVVSSSLLQSYFQFM